MPAAEQRRRAALVLRGAPDRAAGRPGLRQRDGDGRGSAAPVQHPLAAVPPRRRGLDDVRHADDFRQREPCPLVARAGQAPALGEPLHRAPGHAVRPVRPTAAPVRPAQLDADADASIRPAWPGRRGSPTTPTAGIAADAGAGRGARPEHRRHHEPPALGVRPRRRATRTAPARSPSRSAAVIPRWPSATGRPTCWRSATSSSPNETWRTFKKQKTGASWDYVFRRLFYTWYARRHAGPTSPHRSRSTPSTPPAATSATSTSGSTRTGRPTCSTSRRTPGRAPRRVLPRPAHRHDARARRDRPGPGLPPDHALAGGEGSAETPDYARFHVTADGSLHVVATVTGVTTAKGAPFLENRLIRRFRDRVRSRRRVALHDALHDLLHGHAAGRAIALRRCSTCSGPAAIRRRSAMPASGCGEEWGTAGQPAPGCSRTWRRGRGPGAGSRRPWPGPWLPRRRRRPCPPRSSRSPW